MKILLALCLLALAAPVIAQDQERWVFLDNGQVRLGSNLSAGGCIGWFSLSGSKDNVLNAYDVGRYLQQSYYGDADGSDWNGKPWRYNPVQGGSWRNQPAKVIQSRKQKDHLYAKIHPRHWATGELLKEVTMEQWLRLEGKLARLKFKMTYSGEKEHRPYHQELPALFVKPALDTLIFVREGGDLQRKQPGFPNELFRLGPKPWAAWVDAQDAGLGLYVPHAEELTSYRVRNDNVGDCSYCAPIRTFALKPGLVFEYEVVLTIGSLEEMQAVFGRLQGS